MHVSTKTWIVVISQWLAIGVAWWLGAATRPEPTSESAPAPKPAPFPGARVTCPPVDREAQQARIRELGAGLGRHERRRAEAEKKVAEMFGDPDPIEVSYDPGSYRPGVMRGNMDRLFEQCRPDARIIGFGCEEGECLATVEGDEGWWTSVRDCEGYRQWRDTYGPGVELLTGVAECADGSVVAVDLWGPSQQPSEGCDGLDDDACDEARYDRLRRLKSWADEVAAEQGCDHAQ